MFLSLARQRRSIRRYENRAIEPETLDDLMEAALRAPSSRGINPWQFIFVTEPNLLKTLASAKQHGSSFLDGAALGIVVCGDPSKSDCWIEDTSIAATYIQLAAESLGLSSCWVQIRDRLHDADQPAEAFVSGLLGIPPGFRVECIVSIGYAAERKPPHSRGSLLFDRIHENAFGTPHPLAKP